MTSLLRFCESNKSDVPYLRDILIRLIRRNAISIDRFKLLWESYIQSSY